MSGDMKRFMEVWEEYKKTKDVERFISTISEEFNFECTGVEDDDGWAVYTFYDSELDVEVLIYEGREWPEKPIDILRNCIGKIAIMEGDIDDEY